MRTLSQVTIRLALACRNGTIPERLKEGVNQGNSLSVAAIDDYMEKIFFSFLESLTL